MTSPDYKALIEEVRALFDEGWCVCRSSHLPGDLLDAVEALLAAHEADMDRLVEFTEARLDTEAERDALQAENEKLRTAYKLMRESADRRKEQRDALQARLDAMTVERATLPEFIKDGTIYPDSVIPRPGGHFVFNAVQRLVGPWTVVPEGDD
jgi:hypothetical protein